MPEGKSEIPADIEDAAKRVFSEAMSFNTDYESEEVIAKALLAERHATESKISALLKDPAAVRINYLRGDIACQVLIEEAIQAERERCAQLADDEADKLKLRDGPDKRRDPLNKQIVAMKVVCRDIASAIRNRPPSTEENLQHD